MQHQDEHAITDSAASMLYNRHAANLLAYARLHTASWQDAEDLTFEVFLAAMEHDNLCWLNHNQQVAWLRRVAHNKLIDSYRRPGHPPVVPLEQVVEAACHDEALTPEQTVLRREELVSLYHAVGALPLEQQQVLLLRYGEGLRFAEIAVLLHKRETAVRKICSRSLARLRIIYSQH